MTNQYSGSVIIYNGSHHRQKHISSKSEFFKGELIVKAEYDRVVFTKPSLDYRGKSYKLARDNGGYYHMQIVSEIPNGTFEFDIEESNEDCRIIYLK